MSRIKALFRKRREDKQQLRELLVELEGLVDPYFLDRAMFYAGKLTPIEATILKIRGGL